MAMKANPYMKAPKAPGKNVGKVTKGSAKQGSMTGKVDASEFAAGKRRTDAARNKL